MSKIRNDFIKQHQRRRWRYLSLLAQSVDAHFPASTMAHAYYQRVPNFTKKHLKNSPHFIYVLGLALGNARRQNTAMIPINFGD